MQTILNQNESDVWTQIAPLLDAAMSRLNETDRHAVVLRFFDGKSLREVGTALGANENAARMRVDRALEKLRLFFTKRGISSTTTIIAGAISAHSVQAAPEALAKTVTAVALGKGATASGSTITLIKGTLKIMAWTKAKTAIVMGLGILLTVGTGVVVSQNFGDNRVIWSLDVAVLDKEPPVVLVRRAKRVPGLDPSKGAGAIDNGNKMLGLRRSLKEIVEMAYKPAYRPNSYWQLWQSDRVMADTPLPDGAFDFVSATQESPQAALQALLKEQFGLTARTELREVDALILSVKTSPPPGLKLAQKSLAAGVHRGGLTMRGDSLGMLASQLENAYKMPVIDKTGLTNLYDADLTWKAEGRAVSWPSRDEINQILQEQLGLELVPSRESVEMLIIDKVK